MGRFDWISFTSDYGLSDGFVAECHGSIARIAPAVRVIDVSHHIAPRDIGRAASVLAQVAPSLPPCVHLAVVDPGVGTMRRAIAIEAVNGILVGPDNGVLPQAAGALGGITQVVELAEASWFAPTPSPTFHGRDIFAPSAARLALGADLTEGGPLVNQADLVRLPEPIITVGDGWVDAEVRCIDRFGNIQLAARDDILQPLGSQLTIGTMPARRVATFGDVAAGSLLVFVDSAGYVSIAMNGGRAVVALSVLPGDLVRIAAL